MNLGTEGWGLIALGGLLAYVSNVFYMWGGTQGFSKVWRRFIGASVLASTANFIALFMVCWSWQYLLFYPCLIGGFCLGYGGDTTTEKIIKRTIYALGVLSACFFGMWAHSFNMSSIIVFMLAVFTGLSSVVLGVTNPFVSARLEEFMVCQVLTLYIPFWALVK